MLQNQLYYFNLYSEFYLRRVETMKRGELIPWSDPGWVDTVTRGKLIPWPGASWYHDLGQVDTGVTRGACYWGELIPWPGASWYQDLGWVDIACPEVVSQPSLWSVLVTTLLIVYNVRPNLLSPCQLFVYFYVMDCILRLPASSEPSSPVSSPCKKPVLNAMQGDVSASSSEVRSSVLTFTRVQWWKVVLPPLQCCGWTSSEVRRQSTYELSRCDGRPE
jgi:hypothetical protein